MRTRLFLLTIMLAISQLLSAQYLGNLITDDLIYEQRQPDPERSLLTDDDGNIYEVYVSTIDELSGFPTCNSKLYVSKFENGNHMNMLANGPAVFDGTISWAFDSNFDFYVFEPESGIIMKLVNNEFTPISTPMWMFPDAKYPRDVYGLEFDANDVPHLFFYAADNVADYTMDVHYNDSYLFTYENGEWIEKLITRKLDFIYLSENQGLTKCLF